MSCAVKDFAETITKLGGRPNLVGAGAISENRQGIAKELNAKLKETHSVYRELIGSSEKNSENHASSGETTDKENKYKKKEPTVKKENIQEPTNTNPIKKKDKTVQEMMALNKESSAIAKAYKTEIEKGEIKINSMKELMEFNAKYNDSIDGTTAYQGRDIKKATQWYNGVLSDMDKRGFKFQPLVIKVVDKIVDKDGYENNALGMAFTNKNEDGRRTVILAENGKHRIMPALTVVHEYVHTITMEALKNDPHAKARIAKIMSSARKKLEVNGKLPIEVEYAFTNEGEFIAEVMSNPILQNKLNEIESGSIGVVERARKLFNSIMDRFKGDKQTLLTEALNEVYELQLTQQESDSGSDSKTSDNKSVMLNKSYEFGNEIDKKKLEKLEAQRRELEIEKMGEIADEIFESKDEIKDWLNRNARMQYGTTDKRVEIKAKQVEINEELDTKVILESGHEYTFLQGQDRSKDTKAGKYVRIEGLNWFTNKLQNQYDIINPKLDTIANAINKEIQECK